MLFFFIDRESDKKVYMYIRVNLRASLIFDFMYNKISNTLQTQFGLLDKYSCEAAGGPLLTYKINHSNCSGWQLYYTFGML